jgi:hypothetical protein
VGAASSSVGEELDAGAASSVASGHGTKKSGSLPASRELLARGLRRFAMRERKEMGCYKAGTFSTG